MPVDPTMLTTGADWAIPSDLGAPDAVQGGGDFAGALARSIGSLEQTQVNAAQAADSLATGTASDPESAVMAVERARLAMQLAAQLRTTTVSAIQDLFHTQV
jgi:flagellar hook-basal body complex protein FliE